MWYLKYSYKLKNGEQYLRTSLLETGVDYTLGRGSKNSFKIEKPTVSAVHLKFTIDPIDFPLTSPVLKLKVIGQSATINDELLNVSKMSKEEREALDYKEFKNTVSVKISGVTIKFYNKMMLLKVNNELVEKYQRDLVKLGIPFTTTYLPETTHLIKKQMDNSLDVLAALLTLITINKPAYIDTLINNLDLLKEDYEKNLPKAEDFVLDKSYIPNALRTELFKDLVFIFFDLTQFNYLTPILKIGNTKTELFSLDDIEASQICDFVNGVISSNGKQPVIVQPEIKDDESRESRRVIDLLNQAVKQLGVYLITNEDIFKSILNLNLDILTRKRPPKMPSTVMEDSVQPPKKKRRGKVKALDSLDFFGGGGMTQVENSMKPEKTQLKDIPEEIQVSETQGKSMDVEPVVQEPPKKKSRSRIKPMTKGLIDSAESMKVSQELVVEIPSSQPKPVLEEKEEEMEEEVAELPGSNVSQPQPAEVALKQHSFLAAAQTTKKEANKRIQNELGSIENIDENTIKSLKNLAIVENVDIPMRTREKSQNKHSRASTLQNQMKYNYWDPKWTGRKNFKIFVKVSKNTNSNANKTFVQTHIRNYVPMELVSLDKVRKKGPDDELLESNERHQQKERQETQKSRHSGTLNDSTFNKRTEALFVNDSDSEEDNENQGAGFQFTTDIEGIHNTDGLGMNVRVMEGERTAIPEFRRFNNILQDGDNFDTSHDISTSNHRNNVMINDNNEDKEDDDDDDDDDETPRFRFRS